MKKAYLLLALASITVFSCTKNHSTYTTVDSRDTTGFTVSGIADMEIESRDSIMFPIWVERVSGVEQKLTFSITGLPENVTGTFNPESGYNFSTMLTLVSKKAALGSSNVKIMVSGSAGVIRTYSVKLSVVPKMYCLEEIMGNYMGDYVCTNDSDNVSSVIMQSGFGGNNSLVSITNLVPGFGFAVDAKLTCEGQKLAISNQQFGPIAIWGTGDFSVDSMVTIDYSYFDGIDTITCTTNLKKQP